LAVRSRPRPPANLILISIDTLRADRVGCYGYSRDTSPFLDSLAKRGAVFENFVAECSWTLPSHVTMFSGIHPATHGVNQPRSKIRRDTRLLAEVLQAAGYRTIGLAAGGFLLKPHGFGRGFETYLSRRKSLAEILDDARARLDGLERGDRYFLFLHTYDVHCPYAPSEEYSREFVTEDAEFVETKDRCWDADTSLDAMSLTEGQVRYLSDRYDASIREADQVLGEFLAFLESRGDLRRTLIVVTSDHGEEFREHGSIGHKGTLYREALMVPLVMAGPKIRPMRVDAPVGLVDLMPTVLDLLGIPIPEGVEGASLLPLLEGKVGAIDGGEARVSEIEWPFPLKSVMTRERHLIADPTSGTRQLYAVGEDPSETIDLAASRLSEADELFAVLDEHASRSRPTVAEDAPVPLTAEQVEELRQLGYVR